MTEQETIQKTIVEQLYTSTVNGFPFFTYTGVRAYTLDEEAVCLYGIPKNPNKITGVRILYDYGADTYEVHVFTGDQMNAPAKSHGNVHFDELAELVASEMGVI